MLIPINKEFQEIHDMALKTGIIENPVSLAELLDTQFIPADIKPANIKTGGEISGSSKSDQG
jgi:hypothetical protein